MNTRIDRVEPDAGGVDLKWVWAVLRRRVWMVAVCILIGILLAFVITTSLPSKYEATTTLMVQPAQDTRTSDYEVILIGSKLALVYTDMVKSQPILKEVITNLKLPETPQELADKINVVAVKDTQLIRITVTDSAPKRAALLANALGQTLSSHVQGLQVVRYDSSSKILEDKIKTYSTASSDLQDKINVLNTARTEADAEITRLETQNSNYRLDYQSLQQSWNSLQLTISQQTDQVKIIEPARAVTSSTKVKPAATVLILFDQSMLSSTTSAADPKFGERLMNTYGPMIKSQSVLGAVIKEQNLSETPENLAENITIETVPGAPILRIIFSNSDPAQAVKIANAIANAFLNQIQTQLAGPFNSRLAELQQQLDDLSAKMDQTQADIKRLTLERVSADTELNRLNNQFTLTSSDLRAAQQSYDQLSQTELETADQLVTAIPAQPPDLPVDRRLINMAMAALVGLMLGVGLIFVREQMEDKIRTSKDVSDSLGSKTIITISPLPDSNNGTVVDTLPFSGMAEDFRLLSARVKLTKENSTLNTLLVTSPVSSEGKSITSANLAIALARTGIKVVLIDADLRRPRVHQIFDLPQENGLTDCLRSGNMTANLHLSKVKGLAVMTSGTITNEPTELLSSPQMGKLLRELASKADIVLIDCPPVLPVADTSILASLSDGVLMVLRSGVSEKRAAREAYDNLCGSRAQVVGIVLAGVSNHGGKYYKYHHPSKGELN